MQILNVYFMNVRKHMTRPLKYYLLMLYYQDQQLGGNRIKHSRNGGEHTLMIESFVRSTPKQPSEKQRSLPNSYV